jgi:serine/threonine-protein kinase HipA
MLDKRIHVALDFGDTEVEVGELVVREGQILFKYEEDFLRQKMAISPIYLSEAKAIHVGPSGLFEGLFGVFNDSLPDAWGRLLVDRALSSHRIPLIDIGPLDRLALVGAEGMGALIYRPAESLHHGTPEEMSLDAISAQAQRVLDGESDEVLDLLLAAGGSSGGARPKVFVGYSPEENRLLFGRNALPENFEHWIVKFPSSYDDPEIAKIEMAYHKMALAAGVKMNPCELLVGQSNKVYFATKRFDRIGNQRLHMHSASGLLHDDFRRSQLDYGHLLYNGYELTKKASTYEDIFRLAAFNVYAHNRDDHSKNFAFLMDKTGDWSFAPAYDLTLSNSSHGMHSTTVAGEGHAPGKAQLMELAETFLISKAEKIIEEVRYATTHWGAFAASVHLSSAKIESTRDVLSRVNKNQ